MENNHKEYLECERHWVFALLIFVGGFYGVYTYLLRGGVFCNAQTANCRNHHTCKNQIISRLLII